MPILRKILLIFILISGISITFILVYNKVKTPLGVSFAPLFQAIGVFTNTSSVAMGKILPADYADEQKLGDTISKKYASLATNNVVDSKYLNTLMKGISIYAKKTFQYKVFIVDNPYPNAFALPGGNIVVTKGLLSTLQSEGELVSVLAHEMGHIELSHCFNLVKYELNASKIGMNNLGKFFDFMHNLFLRHSYSKTEEGEADNYSFKLLVYSNYDPICVSRAYMNISKYYNKFNFDKARSNIVNDYFMTHPPTEIRIEKYSEKAKTWWLYNKNKKRYIGTLNLKNRVSFQDKQYPEEWSFYHKAGLN